MLLDFLYDCQCELENEKTDFHETLKNLSNKSLCVGFMPAITDDLYPIFALSCTAAKHIILPNVYIIPVGAHNYWAKPYFESIINKFYEDDVIREQFDIELEEMLLLNNHKLNCPFILSGEKYSNVVLCHITLPSESDAYLIVVPETPDDCWSKLVEPYEIKCDIIIDSNKGLGNWFDDVPIYKLMRETRLKELLPQYYFRGLYISHDAPPGFKLLYTIPEKIDYQGHEVDDWQKEIYEIDWCENRKE